MLDLGCGVGAVNARLHQMGAQVIGVDGNKALLDVARQLHPAIRFERLDLAALSPSTFGPVDGIWSSFVAAYVGDLDGTLALWRSCLAPGSWIALVEIDDLFGHQPLAAPFSEKIGEFYDEARAARRRARSVAPTSATDGRPPIVFRPALLRLRAGIPRRTLRARSPVDSASSPAGRYGSPLIRV